MQASERKHSIRLAAFDMEGCLTRDPTAWEIMHRKLGTWHSHGWHYWRCYLGGELHYDDFARLDVSVWRGADYQILLEAASEVGFMPGARSLLGKLHEHDIYTVIISNGLMCVAERFCDECGVNEVFANRVDVKNGRLTGELKLDVPYNAKGDILRRVMERREVAPRQVAAVGDGSADVSMFEAAGTAVAICPEKKSVSRAATDIIDEENLSGCADIILGVLNDGRFL